MYVSFDIGFHIGVKLDIGLMLPFLANIGRLRYRASLSKRFVHWDSEGVDLKCLTETTQVALVICSAGLVS